jgi:hypothetical protein
MENEQPKHCNEYPIDKDSGQVGSKLSMFVGLDVK